MTVVATIVLAEEAARELADLISDDEEIGADAVDLNEVGPGTWRIQAYFGHADPAARARLAHHARQFSGTLSWQELPETDWVALSLAGIKPVRAERILVYGQHDSDKVRPNDIAIRIEAGQAFGTGHHGTTQGCLLAIQAVVKSRKIRSALDIGTGSGVLAIAIAKLTASRVFATDVDPVAVSIARENAGLNGARRRVRVATAGAAYPHDARARRRHDLIVANILAGPLVTMAPAIRRQLAEGGIAVLSGLLPEQRARIVATYRGQGLRLTGWRIVDGWLTVTMERPRKAGTPKR